MKIIKHCGCINWVFYWIAAPHSFSFVQLSHSTVATVHIFYYIFSTRLLAMTERRALRYRSLHIDMEKTINELLDLYSNDGSQRLMYNGMAFMKLIRTIVSTVSRLGNCLPSENDYFSCTIFRTTEITLKGGDNLSPPFI